MCVNSTFAACLQMNDASSWSGKWEPIQRAEPYAEAERQTPLLYLFIFAVSSLCGFKAQSGDMRGRGEKKWEGRNSRGEGKIEGGRGGPALLF